jgi:hypothetical protein
MSPPRHSGENDLAIMIRWQDWANFLLGCWLVVSPDQLEYSLNAAASGNALGLGAVLVIFNLISACRLVEKGQEIFNIMLGTWLLLSPFALGFEPAREATINAMTVGALVVVLAVWQMRDAIRRGTK